MVKNIILTGFLFSTFAFFAFTDYKSVKSYNSNFSAIEKRKIALDTPIKLSDKEKITKIRELYQSVEANTQSYRIEKKEYRNPDPELYYDMSLYDAYYNDSELKKLVEMLGEEGYYLEIAYYFNEGNVFFIHAAYSYMDNLYKETRIYLYENKIISALTKVKSEDDETTVLSSLKNANDTEFVKDKAQFEKEWLGRIKAAPERFSKGTLVQE